MKVRAGQDFVATTSVNDPDRDLLTFEWQVVPESTDLKTGGDRESEPEPVKGLIVNQRAGKATIGVYDIRGGLVKILAQDLRFDAGTSTVTWDGTDSRGQPVSSGVYFSKVVSDHGAATAKMTLVK